MSQDFKLDKNWRLKPITGDTGQTYMGVYKDERVFVKRNTSPFLAALSQEGLTPKLVWTRRSTTGDVFTAQEWLDGRTLTPNDMKKRSDVIHLLRKLHYSPSLNAMLYRVGGPETSAFDLLCYYTEELPEELKQNKYLIKVLRHLQDNLPKFSRGDFVACHGDLNHRNWLLSREGRLYLVDWDSAMLADPAVDLGTILGRYVPRDEWQDWLAAYGTRVSRGLYERIQWYASANQLLEIKKLYIKQYFQEMNLEILLLKEIFEK